MLKNLNLRNIILMTLISIICGTIFWVAGFLYNVVTVALTPLGLAPLSNDLLIGLWTMAGPLSGYIIRKAGSSLLAELLGSFVEMFWGGQWGASTIISGIEQGIASELGFTILGYKIYGWVSIISTTITTTVITFLWDWFRNGYSAYSYQMLMLLFVTRLISVFVFNGILTKLIANLLEKSTILK
ncbi:ECF transporter S component [Apilactobacillus ozensis]|uniref:ECF transporter S component n=1 Tax=Apilactobacillus ozensis TaxID=866801 RepID=UPI00200B2E98|nr:ECF transporter S component [Apilactobacillus ozensis]MCK8606733.1 ECF transporter S component [Apilactobacillus ozensis]